MGCTDRQCTMETHRMADTYGPDWLVWRVRHGRGRWGERRRAAQVFAETRGSRQGVMGLISRAGFGDLGFARL
eukprot:2908258-Rhodomonas_salina.1